MRNKYTKEKLESVIERSTSWSQVCEKMGVKPSTGSQSHLTKRAKEFGFDTSHFLGQGHRKGKTYKKKDAMEYCFNGSKENSHRLRERLVRDGYKKECCEKCGIEKWLGEEVPLELDHIDSNHYNNELSNLQILCPNCHAVETRKRRGVAGTVDNSVLETEAK